VGDGTGHEEDFTTYRASNQSGRTPAA
jgi:hypothetical protein